MIKNRIMKFLDSEGTGKFLIFMILANLVIFIADTDINFHNYFSKYLLYFEVFSAVIFSIEYILRVVVLKKFKDVLAPLMIIDLLAILPFYLSFIPINTIFLRVLRMFRLFRIFKIGRYTDAFENIKNGFASKKNELIVTGLIFLSGILVSSTLIYYAENQVNSANFASIPKAFWWSVITFTSVGYGDAYPVTALGKTIGGLTAIMGVGLHGLLVAIIGAAFMELLSKKDSPKPKVETPEVMEKEKIVVKL